MTKKKNKKEKKQTIERLVIVSTMMLSIIVAMVTYWIFAYNHKLSEGEIPFKNYRVSDYVDVQGNTVTLRKIPEEIMLKFSNEQNKILRENKIVSTDIKRSIAKGILSVKITYVIETEFTNYEEIITLNYNLQTQKEVENDDLLQMAGVTYKEIAKEIFDEYVKLPDSDSEEYVIDAITEKKITAQKFNEDSEKYIIRIREKLPEVIKLYIDNNKLNYIVQKKEIEKVCYYINHNESGTYIEKELGKI